MITQKHKNKKVLTKFKKFISFILAASLLLSTAPVYADENAAASTGGGGSTTVAGGASVSRQGVRMYMLDPNGQLCSQVVDLVTKQPTGITTRGSSTRLGGGTTGNFKLYPSGMPKPIIFTSEWKTNGYAVKAWLGASGGNNGTQLIGRFLGSDALAKYQSAEEYFLVLEPLYWHKVPGSTEVYYGTAFEWISTGRTNPSSVTRNFDNLTAPNCMILDHERFGLLAPPKYGGNYITTFGNFGYGIHMYSNSDLLGGSVQDTYNPAMAGSPHAAPEPTVSVPLGNNGFTIVKSYRGFNKSTNIKQDLGTYATDTSSSTIRVSNESGFKLVGWKASTSTNKNVPSLTWESSVPNQIKQTGSSAAEVDLSQTKSKCLYVLFEKVEDKDEVGDYNYLLHQSQITRRVGLYKDDHNMPIMSDHTFWWQSPAFKCEQTHQHQEWEMTSPEERDPKNPSKVTKPAEYGWVTHNCGDCSNFVLTDNAITLSLQNAWANSYPNQLSTVLWQEQEYKWTATRENVQLNNKRANGTSPAKFGLKVVFHRGDDALTIAQWKGTGTHLGGLSSFHVANTPAGTRRSADYIKKIGIYITDGSPDRLTIADATQHADACARPTTPRLCLGVQRFHSLQGDFSTNINIKYETYSGSNKKFEDVSPDYNVQTVSSNKHGTNDVYVEAPIGVHQTYYPYIQMRYDTLTGFDSPSGNGIGATNSLAYVLSEYQSSLYLNGAAEIIWQGSNSPNLNITSDQWSTHADFYDILGNEALNSIIPGGAQLGMNTIGTTKKVRLVTYYPVFKGDGAAQINATSSLNSVYTEAAAEAAHNAFVDSVIQDIEGVSVDQFVDENYAASMNELYSQSNIVFRGSNISRLRSNGGSATKASVDNKYYFDHLGEIESMQEGDFDIISKTDKPVVEATVVYKSDGSFAAQENGVDEEAGEAGRAQLFLYFA